MRRIPRPSFLGLAAAALSGAVAVLYLVLIAQGAVHVDGDQGWVAIVVLVLFGQTALVTVAAFRRSPPLLVVSAVLLLSTGILGLFSIGMPLIVASMLAGSGAVWTSVRTRR